MNVKNVLFFMLFFYFSNVHAWSFSNWLFGDVTKTSQKIVENLITELQTSSTSWQDILTETRDQLVIEGHSLSTDISSILNNSIANTGIEAKCFADFMRSRVINDLKRLLSKIKKVKINLVPVLCKPEPSSVDYERVKTGRTNVINLYGFNFDAFAEGNTKLFLVDKNSNRIDISTYLSTASQYIATINLGSNGVPINFRSDKIEIKYSGGNNTISIIQPRDKSKTIGSKTFKKLCPSKVGNGDREFAGHGPRIKATAHIFMKRQREVWIEFTLHAKETKSDWSEARGKWTYKLWEVPPDYKILNVHPLGLTKISYISNGHEFMKKTPTDGRGIIKSWSIRGDTSGKDIGNCTSDDTMMEVATSPIRVRYNLAR